MVQHSAEVLVQWVHVARQLLQQPHLRLEQLKSFHNHPKGIAHNLTTPGYVISGVNHTSQVCSLPKMGLVASGRSQIKNEEAE